MLSGPPFSLPGANKEPEEGQPQDELRNSGQAEYGPGNSLEGVNRRKHRREYQVTLRNDRNVPVP